MSLKFFIFDRTNNWERAKTLQATIRSHKHDCIDLQTLLSDNSDADVILFHKSNFGPNTLALLERLAAQDKVIVVYTAGPSISQTNNRVHLRSLLEVEQLLNWLTETWTIEDVRKALDLEWVEDQTQGFTALAILAQGAAASGLAGINRKRQILWQTNQQPWREILGTTGLGLLRQRAEKDGKRNAAVLLTWIDSGGTPPDFAAAAKEAAELAG